MLESLHRTKISQKNHKEVYKLSGWRERWPIWRTKPITLRKKIPPTPNPFLRMFSPVLSNWKNICIRVDQEELQARENWSNHYPYIVPYRIKNGSIEIIRLFHTPRAWPKHIWLPDKTSSFRFNSSLKTISNEHPCSERHYIAKQAA